MKVIDMHCDTILALLEQEENGHSINYLENDLSINLNALKKGNVLAQNFALFTDLKKRAIPEEETMKLYDLYCRMLEEHSDLIAPVLTYGDIAKNEKEGKISALLTLEEGDVVFSSLAMLRNYYRMGVRMIALTWNYPNRIGSPNLSAYEYKDSKIPDPLQRVDTEHGLSEFGIDYLREMEKLGIIVDVSHLSDAGFWDVVKYASRPFVASHSNARKICGVARNLSDEMILALHEKGGVMGLNFCGDFLSEDRTNTSRIEDMIQHIDHIKKIAGIDVIGIGSDFDGINSQLEVADASQFDLLANALLEHGYSQEEVEKIFYKNVLRVYSQVLPE